MSGVLPHPPTKTVVLYRNGDPFFAGRKLVVNQRQMPTFEGFLSAVTTAVEAPFGAVRSVYTPRGAHRVLSLEHLQHGACYVAAGPEKFKKLNYHKIAKKKPQTKKDEPIQPVIHSKINVSARWRRVSEPCAINVFTNGDILSPPIRILIPKQTLKSWDSVLAMVNEKVVLRRGAVQKLCTLDGMSLHSSSELENNKHYVAVGAERFRVLPYLWWVSDKRPIEENGDVKISPTKRHIYTNSMHSYQMASSAKEGETHVAREFQQINSNSPFYTRAERKRIKKRVSRVPQQHTIGEVSVFKAKDKRKETSGAAEVQEDGQVEVDLPIDEMEANAVDEDLFDQGALSRLLSRTLKQPDAEGDMSAGFKRASASPAESRRSNFSFSARVRDLETPAEVELQGKKEEAPLSRKCWIRSRVSKLFKGRFAKA